MRKFWGKRTATATANGPAEAGRYRRKNLERGFLGGVVGARVRFFAALGMTGNCNCNGNGNGNCNCNGNGDGNGNCNGNGKWPS